MNNNNYNIKLKSFARVNRKNGTRAEIKLWCELLRNKQMMGFPFLRQRPIGNYIADFLSKDLDLIIEVDGLSHNGEVQLAKDKIRENDLECMGFNIIRFNDSEVIDDIENVRRTIETYIIKWKLNHPPTPFKGGSKIAKESKV
ncbi:endonuclease domain-containing protein [Pedobacter sp. Leaf176]|uniref:endonuclease domain-containing protein n=1 Tax=Pedobacter sp. Leaf176 TaxID=1736286 RepID=UPI0009EB8C8B|nr:endonuclease domain-containing protein [Pedobacter sp. Leaf176]